MRICVLLMVFAMPPLVACGAAYAKTAADIGKPVCMHFDESGKPVSHTIAAPTTATTSVSATNAGGASSAQQSNIVTPQVRSGGTAGAMRAHAAPHWQTFLPGMFR